MKDYYDIWYLSRHFAFDGQSLAAAIRNLRSSRHSLICGSLVLSSAFAEDASKVTLWKAFRNRSQLVMFPKPCTM